MNSLNRSIAAAFIVFAAAALGMALQWVVPPAMLAESRGAVGGMIGLVTLLLALVLGLLVYTAFAVFATQQSEAQSLGPLIVDLDLNLELYGPAAADGRAGLRAALERSRLRFFGDSQRGPQPFTIEQTRATFAGLSGFFDNLTPETDLQSRQLANARDLARRFNDTQMLMARQLANPFPPYVIAVVICWAGALFFGSGLIAAPNVVTVAAHLAGGAAIGSAIFLILELSSPYTGFVRLTPTGIDRMLQFLGSTPPA